MLFWFHGDQKKRTTPPEGFMLDGLNLKYAYIEDVIDQLDVLIEGTLVIELIKLLECSQAWW